MRDSQPDAGADGFDDDGNGWHGVSAADVLARLDVSADAGLTEEQASARLDEHGPNRLPDEARDSALVRFLKQFHNVLIYILIAAAIFTALLGEWIDTAVIIAVVLVNAAIGFIQEGKAERALDEIRRMLSLDAAVLRDGRRTTVAAERLVPGDVVLLEGGDRVPADLRVIAAREARVDEAALTGESEAVFKTPDPVAAEALLGDRTSMAYSGTLVAGGQLRGVVVATGEATELGRIGQLVAGVEKVTTPLLEKIHRFGRLLSVGIVGFGLLLFLFGWLLRGFSSTDMFMVVVSFAVAAIPEGLPAILTITLALGVQRMSRRNAIVRRLPAVETLGSVTTICSDKTGTLTRNELTVGRALLLDRILRVTGAGYDAAGEIRDGADDDGGGDVVESMSPALVALARAVVLCNDAELATSEDGSTVASGDPLDAALLVFARKVGLDPDDVRRAYDRVDAIPFESGNRFMATLDRAADGTAAIHVKGAPERVLDMCTHVLAPAPDGDPDGDPNGDTGDAGGYAHADSSADANGAADAGADLPLDHAAWRSRIDEIAAQGFRMIAVASRPVAADQDTLRSGDVEDGLRLAGVVGLDDPPRPEAIDAVAECQRAGIRVVMITGDHALTARSIGARLGIGDGSAVVTGHDVEQAGEEELADLVQQHDVIARASPEHKLRLVRALQARGEVVAMTGDGVNDSPALKQADIGVAMGIKGTEAAKSAAEMVLADDNFASIEHAVEEGRTVYDNLKKTILFLLPTNGAEALMLLAAVAFALPAMPITPVQILWVNMVTAVTLALALAFEPTEPDIMARPPRGRSEPILERRLLVRVGYVSALVAAACVGLFLLLLEDVATPGHARTVTVNALVAAETFYLFNCRFIWRSAVGASAVRGNRAVLLAVGALVLLQLAFTYAPPMQAAFGTAPLGLRDWAACLLLGVVVFLVVEAEKAWGRSKNERGLAPDSRRGAS
jgi:magnesium-transporting ATPase (P-type)